MQALHSYRFARPGRAGGSQRVALRPRPSTLVARAAQVQVTSEVQGANDGARPSEEWSKLKGLKVYRASDGAPVEIPSLWNNNERAVVAFARSFGCFFCWELAIQLRRDVKPLLDDIGVKLYLVSVGTSARALDFVKETGFPAENLLADPDNITYDALGLKKGVAITFFDINTPYSFKKRFEEGRLGDLQDVLPRWKPWLPPKRDQGLQQGGMFVFQGDQVLFSHKDQSTGAHTDLQDLLSLASKGLSKEDCGCDVTPETKSL